MIAFFSIALLALGGSQSSPPKRATLSLQDIQRTIDLIGRELAEGEHWIETDGTHVKMYYVSYALEPGSQRRFVEVLDNAVTTDCRTLQLQLPEKKVPVYLYPNGVALGTAVHLNKPIHGGVSLGFWSAIALESNEVTDVFKGNAYHEVGHAVVHNDLGLYGCSLFAEGIAILLKGSAMNEAWVHSPKPVESKSILQLCDTAQTTTDYTEGAKFLAYLQKNNGGITPIKKLMTALSQQRLDDLRRPGTKPWPTRVNSAFYSVYGSPVEPLEAKWRRSVGQ